jgi:hypothetical protein
MSEKAGKRTLPSATSDPEAGSMSSTPTNITFARRDELMKAVTLVIASGDLWGF